MCATYFRIVFRHLESQHLEAETEGLYHHVFRGQPVPGGSKTVLKEKKGFQVAVAMHTCNPTVQEAEAGGFAAEFKASVGSQ